MTAGGEAARQSRLPQLKMKTHQLLKDVRWKRIPQRSIPREVDEVGTEEAVGVEEVAVGGVEYSPLGGKIIAKCFQMFVILQYIHFFMNLMYVTIAHPIEEYTYCISPGHQRVVQWEA